VNDCRSDVQLTSYLEPMWINRDPDLQSLIRWTFAATSTGVLRLHPGVEVDTELDLTRYASSLCSGQG